jgi:hypothetical protein
MESSKAVRWGVKWAVSKGFLKAGRWDTHLVGRLVEWWERLMVVHSERCSADVTEAMWAAQLVDSWSESKVENSACRKVERLGSTWADSMVEQTASTRDAPKAAWLALN